MAAITVNIVLADTFANLKAGEPYSSDHFGQMVLASDFDAMYRINVSGFLVGFGKYSTSSQSSVTGSTYAVSSLPENPTYVAVYVSGQRMFEGTAASTEPMAFYIPSGGGQINFAFPLDEDSILIEFLP